MEPRLQRRVQRYGWDKASAHYEQYWRQQLAPAQRRMLELADLQPGERVLDVACGTGLVTLPAALAVGAVGTVVATDISDSMVEFVRREAAEHGLNQTTFEQMDAEELRFPDHMFDAGLCALGLMYFPHPRRAMEEIHRVLRHAGRTAVAVWGQRNRCGWAEILPIVDARVESDVCPLFFQLGTGDALRYTLELAGFTDIVTERLSTILHYEAGEDALGAAFAGGPVALAYSRFHARTRNEAHAEYLKSIEQYRNGRGYGIPGEFVVASGRKN